MSKISSYRSSRLNRRLFVYATAVKSATNSSKSLDSLKKEAVGESSLLAGSLPWVGWGLLVVQVAGFAGEKIARGSFGAVDDVNYFTQQLQQYIQEYGNSDPTYKKHQKTFDDALQDGLKLPALYNEIEKIPEQLKTIGESVKTGDVSAFDKFKEIYKKVEANNELCQNFLDEVRSITAFISEGRSTLGAISDSLLQFFSLDWIHQLTTFTTIFQRTCSDLSEKIEPHFALIKELESQMLDILNKAPKQDASVQTQPTNSTQPTNTNVATNEKPQPVIAPNALGVARDFLDHIPESV
jgi:hypothetical protein